MARKSKTVCEIEVFPVGIAQFDEFQELLDKIVAALPKSSKAIGTADVVGMLSKFRFTDVLDLVSKCTKPALRESEASLDETVQIVAAWFDLSFSKDSASPLVRSVRAAADAISKEMAALFAESLTTSPTSSQPDSTDSTSSNALVKDGPTPVGHYESSERLSPPSVALELTD